MRKTRLRRKSRLETKTPLRSRTELRHSGIRPANRKRRKERYERDFGSKAAHIRAMPCLVCGATPSEPHHEPPRSRGGTKKDLTPLCADHHTLGPDSRHRLGSAERFAETHNVDLVAEAARVENEWEER